MSALTVLLEAVIVTSAAKRQSTSCVQSKALHKNVLRSFVIFLE